MAESLKSLKAKGMKLKKAGKTKAYKKVLAEFKKLKKMSGKKSKSKKKKVDTNSAIENVVGLFKDCQEDNFCKLKIEDFTTLTGCKIGDEDNYRIIQEGVYDSNVTMTMADNFVVLAKKAEMKRCKLIKKGDIKEYLD